MGTRTQVYLLSEARGLSRDLLGGKGFGLVEMAQAGLPVPPALIITTEACRRFLKEGAVPGLWEEVRAKLAALEGLVGKRFGTGEGSTPPLLVSVRSGAPVSMPGMMDTILNLGLSLEGVESLARATGNPRFAWDAFRRLLSMYGEVVLGERAEVFEGMLSALKEKRGVQSDTELSPEDLEALSFQYLRHLQERGTPFPMDPWLQLQGAIEAVFRSWLNPRAKTYRRIYGIPEDLGTAVVVQAMVYGNLGEDSGTGVGFTRNPATGEKGLYGEYLRNAQGEDVVAGIRTPEPLSRLKEYAPELYREIERVAHLLERHFRDMQDFEFTVERGRLYLLQTRSGKRTAQAAVRIAVEMAEEGLISKEEAVLRVEANALPGLLKPTVDREKAPKPILRGLPASPGAAFGHAVFSNEAAERYAAQGLPTILVRPETTPEDITGMYLSKGILTARGGLTSHAAVVARGLGVPAVVGAEALRVVPEEGRAWVDGLEIREGELLTLDGSTGEVYLGAVPLAEAAEEELLHKLLSWAEPHRSLGVRANADTPLDAERARAFGAEGIGLCRTEHMFFQEERLPWVRRLILARTPEEEAEALERLFVFQKEDFKGILRAMDGLPVTVRLLDPPLHEFLPSLEELKAQAEAGDEEAKALWERAKALAEQNPMLGFRGIRLLLLRPGIFRMQLRALLEAAKELREEGFDPRPEVMVPLVADPKEVERAKALAEELFREYGPIPFGTMVETPRAALLASEIAPLVDFFSFGTNDLTQMAFGLSRDDAGKFLPQYVEEGLFPFDPTERLDEKGVGRLLRLAVQEGKRANPRLKVGLCGEHGGEARSVAFVADLLDYTSASPFRVLTARLAAAQAGLRASRYAGT
ncbi:pyruvate, phosphate dikinase [Thermus scotoductus]|uniref:Pyruvate, phosphate dikinase n=2 Tax=Thermus scotoductus TaxID=37636 RepID=A0A430UZV0_THESC|nr:pyruvate, phosphate dikinase [Thermus scotoductus]RTH00275.1 pyruvate, phosphate dikinase [Thermus scotoductus]RTI01041.1 pyruvate, phosphate dikinase [Thermus scotoductus]RTI15291.1 pyruvate, phosphate dikinase [Thermus scotoductus]